MPVYQVNREIVESKTFRSIDYSINKLDGDEFENCAFVNCNFSNSDLSGIAFLECEFKGCDLSNAKLSDTAFKDVRFISCKLLGLQFNNCSEILLSFTFEDCQMNLASFYQLKLKGTEFKMCNLHEVDFTQTDLSHTLFNECNLIKAVFADTNLEKVDFRSSFSYSIDPEKNRIKKAKFSRSSVSGLLEKYDIEID